MSILLDVDPPEIDPFDPMCERFASEMEDLDWFCEDFFDNVGYGAPITPAMRAAYVIEEEGTYNKETNHFLCDMCYIKAGQPSSLEGWKCP